MVGSSEGPRSQTIVRRVLSADGSERFCVLHEAPQPHCNAFLFTRAADSLTVAEVCAHLIAAGISEPDVYRLLDEARAGHRPHSVTETEA